MTVFAGIRALFEGLAHVATRPALWTWAAIPVALMVVAISAVGLAVWTWVPPAFAAALPPPEVPLLGALYWGVVGYVMLVLFATGAVIAWAASTVLATPFYDVLSARVEAELTGRAPEPVVLGTLLGDAARSIAHTLLASALFAVATGLMAVLALIPAVDVIVPVLEFGIAALFVARELLDFPLSRRRLAFGAKLAVLRDHAAPLFGLGAAATALLWVPLLNFVVMPAAVAGVTVLVVRFERKRDVSAPPTPA